MSNILISVIVPIYNVEEYLVECIESVLGQSYKNLDVILVDDGSPDRCPAICDEYAVKDNRVKVIHKQNGGLSDARNAGLKIATGEYVVFLDSDDYWSSKDALNNLIEIIEQNRVVDIIYFRRFAFSQDSKAEIYRHPNFEIDRVNGKSKIEVLDYLISNGRFIPSACNKMIRREILRDIEFQKNILSEDIDWNFAVTLKAQDLFVTNHLFYAYRMRSGSITQTITAKNVDNLIWIVEKWSTKFKELAESSKLESLLMSYCAYQLTICLALIFSIEDQSRRQEFVERVKKLSFLMKYDAAMKVKKVKLIYFFCGIVLTGKILSYYLKNRR